MIEMFKALLLGIVQGITEWLPISSTGHLILFDQLLNPNLSDAAKEFFLVFIQLGSILAVVVLYFSTLYPFTKTKTSTERKETWMLWLKVAVATIPAGIVGVLFDDLVTERLYNRSVIVLALFVYGVLYLVLEKSKVGKKEKRVHSLEQLSLKDSFALGLFQMLALVPGTSRSGSTILGGMLIGLDRQVAARMSFFMAIPIMAGASLLKLLKLGFSYTLNEWLLISIGFVTSFIVSLGCIKALVNYVRSHDFSVFGIYRIALALVLAAMFLI